MYAHKLQDLTAEAPSTVFTAYLNRSVFRHGIGGRMCLLLSKKSSTFQGHVIMVLPQSNIAGYVGTSKLLFFYIYLFWSIVLNDEQPGLQSWAQKTFTNGSGPAFNSKFYVNLFEVGAHLYTCLRHSEINSSQLLLRLR